MKRNRRVVGDPILRRIAKKVTSRELGSAEFGRLIRDMRDTLKENDYGIAIAAPQIGVSKAVVVIELKPTPTRQDLDELSLVLVNPVITKYKGKTVLLRDGCISIGAKDDPLYGWSERSSVVTVEFEDENGTKKTQTYDGFLAHVMQHEIDHLNGVLFIDRVVDPKTYTHASEFKKRQADRQ